MDYVHPSLRQTGSILSAGERSRTRLKVPPARAEQTPMRTMTRTPAPKVTGEMVSFLRSHRDAVLVQHERGRVFLLPSPRKADGDDPTLTLLMDHWHARDLMSKARDVRDAAEVATLEFAAQHERGFL